MGETSWSALPLAAIGFLIFIVGPFLIWLALYRWMWKQRGRGFAEGWFEVAERRAAQGKPQATMTPPAYVVVGPTPPPNGTAWQKPAETPKQTPSPQYTITGRRIR